MSEKTPETRSAVIRRTALMLLITMVCGVVIAALGGWFFATVITRDDIGFAALGNLLLGMAGGYTLGLMLGVWLAGRLLHRPGRAWQGTFGAVAGVALVMLLAEPLSLNRNQGVLLGLLLVLPALFAVIGHQIRFTRRRQG
jgi:uncharacterized membrane protein YeaQ/YmgE (transglycosylase-associated protein family)